MKRSSILAPLETIRSRYRIQRIVESINRGLFAGSLVAVPLLLVRLFDLIPNYPVVALFAVPAGIGALLGAMFGAFLPIASNVPATTADRHYRLKDRLLTAIKLLPRSGQSPMERLQLEDAAAHAETIDPKVVVPYRLPKHFARTFGVLSLATVLCFVSPLLDRRQDAHAAERLTEVVSTIDVLESELLEKIEELAEKNPEEKALKELSEELKKLLAQLDDSSTDRKESLATLSEMEESIRTAMSEFQLEAVDASMRELAEALSAADATRPAAQALKDENYDRAAGEFDKLESDPSESMSKQERRAVSEQMRQSLQNMQNRGQKSLMKAAEKLADSLERNNASQCKEGAAEMAAECRKQSLRKGICENLEGKLSLLGLCKSECNGSGDCEKSGKDGGNNTEKSDRESKNWGTGAAGDPASGEETNLDGSREQKNITGILGTGDSEYEKMRSTDAPEEKNVRELRDAFQEYRKMSEAVLESEPIPLGQRQMIRRYFESIRPSDGE